MPLAVFCLTNRFLAWIPDFYFPFFQDTNSEEEPLPLKTNKYSPASCCCNKNNKRS